MLRWMKNDAPSPSKAARTILTALNQVKIASQLSIALIYLDLFDLTHAGWGAVAALQQPEARSAKFRDWAAGGRTQIMDHRVEFQ